MTEKGDKAYEELYHGGDGRKPMIVRMESVERVVNWQRHIATTVLISLVIALVAIVLDCLMWVKGHKERNVNTVKPPGAAWLSEDK